MDDVTVAAVVDERGREAAWLRVGEETRRANAAKSSASSTRRMRSASISAGDRKSMPEGSHATGASRSPRKPAQRRVAARGAEVVASAASRVVDREREAERAVRMQALAQRIALARQVVEIARDEHVGERRERAGPPAVARGARARARGATPIRTSARNACGLGPREVGASRLRCSLREMAVEHRVDRGALGQSRMQPAHAREQPVHVHARVPVEAAVERGMHSRGRADVLGAAEHVVGLRRIFAHDVRERGARERRGELSRQSHPRTSVRAARGPAPPASPCPPRDAAQ